MFVFWMYCSFCMFRTQRSLTDWSSKKAGGSYEEGSVGTDQKEKCVAGEGKSRTQTTKNGIL